MNSKEIEDGIRGLLGLSLGGPSVPQGAVGGGRGQNEGGFGRGGQNEGGFGRGGGHNEGGRGRRNTPPSGGRGRQQQQKGRDSNYQGYMNPNRNRGGSVSEEENIAKKNKVRTKKKSENIINIGEDEDDDEDDVMEPRKKEGEMLFAQEALKESSLEKPQEHEYSTSVTDFLGSKYIHLLKKKSVKFPRARWFCRLCEYHCDSLTKCGEHFRDNRHSR